MRTLRFLPFLFIHGLIAVVVLVVFAQVQVDRAGRGRVYSSLESVPTNEVGLLLGTAPWRRDGSNSPFFEHRIGAAADLYRAGRVRYVLASGDNEHRSYNEPVQMKRALVEAGVPEDAIVLDFAGFRTLDSVVRASEVFGQERFTVISQEFHIRRALYIAHHYSLDAVAYAAEGVGGYSGLQAHLRELLARTLAVFDLKLLGTQPRYLGEPVSIP